MFKMLTVALVLTFVMLRIDPGSLTIEASCKPYCWTDSKGKRHCEPTC